MLLIVVCLAGGSVLLIVFCFGRGIRVVHRLLFWEGDPSCSSVFVLGGGSLLLIDLFVLGGGSMRCSTFFVLGGGSVLLIVVFFGRGSVLFIVFFVLGGGSVLLIIFLFWEGDPCCS